MRIPIPPETRSEDLPPVRVNTVTMVLVGIGTWAVALAVVLVLRATDVDVGAATMICLAGIAFGVLALGWAIPQHRRSLRREATAGTVDADPEGAGSMAAAAADETAASVASTSMSDPTSFELPTHPESPTPDTPRPDQETTR